MIDTCGTCDFFESTTPDASGGTCTTILQERPFSDPETAHIEVLTFGTVEARLYVPEYFGCNRHSAIEQPLP